eukprot:4118130-Pyramimonas_sp.AAC.1
MEIAAQRHAKERYFASERPLFASSWASHVVSYVAALPGVQRLRIDMCHFGLQVDAWGLNRRGPNESPRHHPGALGAFLHGGAPSR